MTTEVKMPAVGERVSEGTITAWLVHEGQQVVEDQPLFEISTDKIDTEVPSPASGVLKEIRAEVNETVPVGTVVAIIGARRESPTTPRRTSPTGSGRHRRPPNESRPSRATSGANESQGRRAEEIRLQNLGGSVVEATVTAWLVDEGDEVAEGEPLFEVFTTGIEMVVPCPASGVLREIRVEVDESVRVGSVVAVVESVRTSTSSALQRARNAIVEETEDRAALDLPPLVSARELLILAHEARSPERAHRLLSLAEETLVDMAEREAVYDRYLWLGIIVAILGDRRSLDHLEHAADVAGASGQWRKCSRAREERAYAHLYAWEHKYYYPFERGDPSAAHRAIDLIQDVGTVDLEESTKALATHVVTGGSLNMPDVNIQGFPNPPSTDDELDAAITAIYERMRDALSGEPPSSAFMRRAVPQRRVAVLGSSEAAALHSRLKRIGSTAQHSNEVSGASTGTPASPRTSRRADGEPLKSPLDRHKARGETSHRRVHGDETGPETLPQDHQPIPRRDWEALLGEAPLDARIDGNLRRLVYKELLDISLPPSSPAQAADSALALECAELFRVAFDVLRRLLGDEEVDQISSNYLAPRKTKLLSEDPEIGHYVRAIPNQRTWLHHRSCRLVSALEHRLSHGEDFDDLKERIQSEEADWGDDDTLAWKTSIVCHFRAAAGITAGGVRFADVLKTTITRAVRAADEFPSQHTGDEEVEVKATAGTEEAWPPPFEDVEATPGWYVNPRGPGKRWWDGRQWTRETLDKQAKKTKFGRSRAEPGADRGTSSQDPDLEPLRFVRGVVMNYVVAPLGCALVAAVILIVGFVLLSVLVSALS